MAGAGSATSFPLVSGPALVTGTGLARVIQQWPIIALLWAVVLVRCGTLFNAFDYRYTKLDYSSYYESSFAARKGLDPYTIDLARIGTRFGLDSGPIHHAADTPTFTVCFEPFTYLTPKVGYWAWIGLNIILLVASIAMMLWDSRGIDARAVLLTTAFALLYAPLTQNFLYANSQVLVLFLLVVMMRSLETGRDRLAGAALATAGLLRAFPMLLVVYLLLRRRWRALLYTCVWAAAGGLLTLAILGAPRVISFVNAIGWLTGYPQAGRPVNIGLVPFVSRLFWYTFGAHPGTTVEMARTTAALLARLGLFAMTVIATVRVPAGEDREGGLFSLWVAACVVLSPVAWPHYMVLFIIPFLNVLRAAFAGRPDARAIWTVVANWVLAAIWLDVWYLWARLGTDFLADSAHLRILPSIMVAEMGFVAAFLGYLGAWWFAADVGQTLSPDAMRAAVMPPLRNRKAG